MTTLEAIPLDRIRAEAAEIRPGRMFVTVFVAIFYVIGFVGRKAFSAMAFAGAAVKVGWIEAGPEPQQQGRQR